MKSRTELGRACTMVLASLIVVGGCAGGDSSPTDTSKNASDATVDATPDATVDVGVTPDLPPLPDVGPVPDGPLVVPPDARVDGPLPDLLPPPDVAPPPPDGPVSDAKPCSGNSQCDDGLACTTDICGVAGCTNVITGNFCVIDGKCVGGGTAKADNGCLICQPGASSSDWSNADERGCNDGELCTHTDQCVGGACVGTAYSCDDSLACTDDACNGDDPALGGCDNTIKAGFCSIDKVCYAEAASNPANVCEVCQTATATDAWTVLAPTASPYPIVVSEFLANPAAVDDTKGEWIELHNRGTTAIDLQGWTLRDDGSDSHRITTSVVIAPGAYAVLARSASANGGVSAAYQYASFQLANTADEIVLVDNNCRLVDRVAYGSGWKITSGASLQLADAATDNADPANWCTAAAPWSGSTGDDGTPGAATVCPLPPDAGPDAALDGGGDATVDATLDAGVPDSSVDGGGNVVSCASSGVFVQEVAVGYPDYVALRNYGSSPVDIVGYRLEMYGTTTITPVTYVIEAGDVSGPLQPGATVYLFEWTSGNQAGDINTGANIPFYDGPPGAALPDSGLLFDAAGKLLDYAAVGDNIGKPDNVSFTAVPWPPTFDSSVSSFQRIASSGSCPAFKYTDWYYGPLTR